MWCILVGGGYFVTSKSLLTQPTIQERINLKPMLSYMYVVYYVLRYYLELCHWTKTCQFEIFEIMVLIFQHDFGIFAAKFVKVFNQTDFLITT